MKVVLVEPLYSRNVGAVVRSCANFAVDELILIHPHCETNLNRDFHEAVAGAQPFLDKMTTFDNWEQFNQSHPTGTRIALSARIRKRRTVHCFDEHLLKPMIADSESFDKNSCYLIFGREDQGLSDYDLEHCHLTCSLPASPEMTSLNIAQAVLLTLFIATQNFGATENQAWQKEQSTVLIDMELTQRWLHTLGFTFGDERWNASKTLQELLQRACPTEQEAELIEKIVQQTLRRLSQPETEQS